MSKRASPQAAPHGARGRTDAPRREPHVGCDGCLARHLSVCASLPQEETRDLEAAAGKLSLPAGTTLAHEGAPRREVYTVTSGMLRQVRVLADGRRLVAAFLQAGDFIGLTGSLTHRHTIEAITDTALCAFPLQGMRALCERHPELSSGVLDRAFNALDASESNHMALARMTPLERLAGFLLDMAARQQQRGGAQDRVDLPMTRADIADHLGLTVETVSRSFTRLRREEFVHFDDPRHIELRAPERLRALVQPSG